MAHLDDVLALSAEIFDKSYQREEYEKRLGVDHFMQVGYVDGQPVAFKIGYRTDEKTFYSWFGGVHPDFRRQGWATRLADMQERHASWAGYEKITMKTRRKREAMLNFAQKRGFVITKVEGESAPNDKIHLEKILKPFKR